MKEYIKDYITTKVEEFDEDKQVYLCDLAGDLYEGDNMDGTLTYSRAEAEDWIGEHFWEMAATIKYWKFNGGADMASSIAVDAFLNPEKGMSICVFAYVDAVINRMFSDCEKWDWNDQVRFGDVKDYLLEHLDEYVEKGCDEMDSYAQD